MKYGLSAVLSIALCLVVTGCGSAAVSRPTIAHNNTAVAQKNPDSAHQASTSNAAASTHNSPSSAGKTDGNTTGEVAGNQAGKSTDVLEASTTVKTSPPKKQPVILRVGSQGKNVEHLQQLLAKTGYLPLVWQAGAKDPWHWRYASTPKTLMELWSPTKYTLLTKSAVMTFEQVHHLTVDGVAGPKVFAGLTKDTQTHKTSPYGFTYVQVSLSLPQSLTLWHNGHTVIKSAANGGIPQSPTVKGTYPVYLQYRSQTMKGTDPNGQHYSDPGVPYVSYFYGGEAVHGFVRAHYGYPQSLGCVELPISTAGRVWPYMHLGTLVHVT